MREAVRRSATHRRRALCKCESAAVFEAPAGIAGLDDIAVVGKPVEHGGGHLGVTEDLRPIGECQVGGDQQRGVLVELADQMEQQLAAGLAERQITKLIDDNEIVAQQLLGQTATAAAAFSCSSWLTRSTRLKKRPLARERITA